MITTDTKKYTVRLSQNLYPRSLARDLCQNLETSSHSAQRAKRKPPLASPSRWPQLMSISTLAEYLDMSASSVRNLISDGVLPVAATAPSPRMKRWKRSEIDVALQRFTDSKSPIGPSMTDALRTVQSRTSGGR